LQDCDIQWNTRFSMPPKSAGYLHAFAVLLAYHIAGFVCIQGAAASAVQWRAGGHEPSWSLSRSGGEMTLETDFGANRVSFTVPPAIQSDDQLVRYVTSVSGEPLEVAVKSEVCVDTMTGMPRPQQVTVTLGNKRLTGCGGDPASLLQGREWTVARLAGQPVLAEPHITLTFATDGSVSGLGSCNRFNAAYTLTGEGLSISKGMSSMMACEEPVMKQEQLFLELLERVSRFSIAADGALTLHSDGDRTIVTKTP
jgi:heat shock protein HslJ